MRAKLLLALTDTTKYQMRLSCMGLGVSCSFFFIHAIILLLCFGSQRPSFLGIATSVIGGNDIDQLALLEFKSKVIDDPLHVMSSWNTSIHFCQWHGVTCSRRHQRVTVLSLHSQQLVGYISPHIGNMSFLRIIRLYNNSFSHEIPPEVGRLRRLRTLRLDNNSFTGEIPANVSNCLELSIFGFGFNRLVGKIPAELSSLLKLRFFVIHSNNLTGEIPPFIGNFSSLEVLSATTNNLGGSIPDALGHLPNLKYISVGANRLSGTIPSSIYNLSSLTQLLVPINQIHGTLPSNLGISLPNLQELNIGDNQFTGSIPVSISNATDLVRLIIPLNKFSGKVPSLDKLHKLQWLSFSRNLLGSGEANDLSFLSSLTNATNLQILEFHWNNLGGVLPASISNFSLELAVLQLSNNRIFGSIPAGIGNLVNLQEINVADNQLSGNIPFSIGNLQNLGVLDFSGNKFSGDVPSSVGNLTRLLRLHLARNNLQGSIPSSLGNCHNLLLLDLTQNNLTGAIPPQVIGLSSLSISLDLSQNHLTGSIPTEVGNLKNVGKFNVSENMLSGEIPSSLASCQRLEILSMQGNFFHGTLPSSLSSLRGLQVLDLSRNNLSGNIPLFLEGFHLLQNLNLSFNDFQGLVPTGGVFNNASATSIVGNRNLCGGTPELQLPRCNFEEPKERRLTLNLKSMISIVLGLLGVTLAVTLLFLFWLKRKRNKPASSSSGNSLLQVSYQSLLKSTDGFSSVNLIGEGSFGSVYKGIIDDDGKIIAVKVLNLMHRGASKSFIAECEALRNIRHRNLIKIITACSSVDHHGNDFKALVYEFMVNGSLEEWLHPSPTIEEIHQAPRNLNLLQRLNIVTHVACALDYLHHQCQTPLVHCDLKPSNILLDDNMTGHVGDFGLARFLPEPTHDFLTNQTTSIGIRGSVGYTAPEYGMGSEVSTYGDVYSYGILLLEMLTGKRPTDDTFKDSLNLRNFAKAGLPERVTEIADPILLQGLEEGETSSNNTRSQSSSRRNIIHECLIVTFRIGVACSADLPRERMKISDVVTELHLMRNKLLEAGTPGERDDNYEYSQQEKLFS